MYILTFDIEEWFHLLDNASTKNEESWRRYEVRIHENTDRILQLLIDKKQSASFFCLGWIAEKYPEIIRKISQCGFEICSHTHMHQLSYEQTPLEFKNDVERSIKVLEDLTGQKVTTFRAPGFSISESNKNYLKLLTELGIENDCSIFPVNRAHGGYSSFGCAEPCIIDYEGKEIKEFPLNYYEIAGRKIVFSGGGYFRFIPYFLLKYFMKKSDYVMAYFHPRDFDIDQPIIQELSPLRKFKSYYGLGNAFDKLNSLITDYKFIDLHEAVYKIDWSKVKRISLHE